MRRPTNQRSFAQALGRNLLANEIGLSNLAWTLLIAAIAIAAVFYFPQLRFVITALRDFWSWLAAGAFWPRVS